MFRKSILSIASVLFCLQAFAFEAKYEYPKAFIENKAQFDGRNKLAGTKILYAIDHGPFQVYFTATGMTYRFDKKLPKQKWDKTKPINSEEEWAAILAKRKAVRMESTLYHVDFANANPAVELVATDPLLEYFSYSMGSNSLHYNHIKGYKKLLYKNLYPGIDLEFTFHPEQGFKYQFVVKPGADPNMIALVYNGDVPPRMDGLGNILLTTPYGDAVDHAPISFLGKEKKSIATAFQIIGNKITFALSPYDNRKQLVIDPWVVFPPSPNSNKVWEVETDNSGNVYAYMGDSPFYLRKYNAAGSLQWSYSSSWDSSGFWVGGMVTHPNGDTYITTGSNGEIRKINPSGGLVWYNNPNSLTSYEYWSLAFNCDLTKLVVGGSRATFSFPFPVLRGTMMEINLANGGITSTTVVGFGNLQAIPPKIQEASSICSAPNGNFYFLTLDTVGSINNQLSTIGFKTPTAYNFDYYIPGYGFGTKQPISAIRANGSAFYTHDGQTLHKRDLLTGAVLATASIPSGIINTNPLFGSKTQGNGGLDLDNCGNVYVGSGNGVYKFDASLNLIASASTSGPVYDVDVSNNGEVAASGVNFVATVSLTACPQVTYVCGNPVLATATSTAVSCVGTCDGTATVNPIGGTTPYSYLWNTGATVTTISGLCAGSYTVTVTDAAGTSAVQTVSVGSPTPLVANTSAVNQITCTGANNGSIVVSVTGGAGQLTYSWNTTPPQNGTSISNLSAGTYVLTVTDTSGCQDTLSVTIIEPTPISLQTSSTTSTCNQSSGTATVSASGGTSPYSYNWNSIPSQSTATATGLSSGNYTVLVTDANGCTSQSQVSVQGLNAPTAVATSQPACGSNSGSASVSVNGGAPPYTYSWSPGGANTSSISGVSSGAYQCIVTDANGCSVTVSVSIFSNSLVASASAVNQITCTGANNGSIVVSVTGGAGQLTYSWNTTPPQNGTSISNLSAGTYVLTVTDTSGCQDTLSVTIIEPTPISLQTSSTTSTCNQSSGTATVVASGGTSPYSYNWNSIPSQSTATATGLSSGNYTVLVTDANGCTSQSQVSVQGLSAPTAVAISQPACVSNSGSASVIVNGGLPPYTYSWSPGGANTSSISGVSSGAYQCIVTDANGCSVTVSVSIFSNSLVASASAVNQITCTGANNGSIVVSVTGGAGQLTYSWNTTPPQSGTSISNLSAGTYVLTVTDTSGCQDTLSVTIIEPTPISLQTSSTTSTCNQSSGTATVVASGGTSPYSYNWNSIPSQSTATATGLSSGNYTVLVTDANGCTSQSQVSVQGLSAPTAVATSQPACGSNSGSASVSVNGGAPPYTYAWSPGGANTSSINGVAAGAYQCIVTDANGCSFTALVNILSNPLPTLLSSTQPACGDGNGNATVSASSGTAPYTYQWNPGGSTTASINNITAGSYQCTVTDANGCSQTATVNVVTYALPIVNAGSDVSVISGQSITLTASGGVSFAWTPTAGLSCDTCQVTIATPFVTTTYCVSVTDANGCTGSDCMTLTVDEPCGDVFIPSAFSPDAVNDPENDRFCVYGRCIASLTLSVFDRWGKPVFETSDVQGCWDGTYKGKALNTGVYMYVAKVSLSNGEKKVLKGDVTLVR